MCLISLKFTTKTYRQEKHKENLEGDLYCFQTQMFLFSSLLVREVIDVE